MSLDKYKKLIDHLINDHNLILIDDEIRQINHLIDSQNYPSDKRNESCYCHCTKNGTQKLDCIESYDPSRT